jgi:hypothetical protein
MRRLWVWFALIFIGCCGYSTRSLLPGYLKTIYIQPVQNSTLRPLLGEDLTDELVIKFTRDGNLRVSPDESADLILTIEVTGYDRNALVYDTAATQWSYRLRYKGVCRDQVRNQILWEETRSVLEQLEVDVDEEEAIVQLIESAAEEILTATLLAW